MSSTRLVDFVVGAGLLAGLLYAAAALSPSPGPPAPLAPAPAPAPAPPPGPGPVARLLIVVAPGCAYCDRLKADWPTWPYPAEYVQNSQDVTLKWSIVGTPTVIALDSQGREVKRQLGYLPKQEMAAWLGVATAAPVF